MTAVLDNTGQPVTVGTRCRVLGYTIPGETAVVTDVSDDDADCDDSGRGVLIPPYVTLTWPDGDTDRLRSWRHGHDGPWTCDDIEVVQ